MREELFFLYWGRRKASDFLSLHVVTNQNSTLCCCAWSRGKQWWASFCFSLFAGPTSVKDFWVRIDRYLQPPPLLLYTTTQLIVPNLHLGVLWPVFPVEVPDSIRTPPLSRFRGKRRPNTRRFRHWFTLGLSLGSGPQRGDVGSLRTERKLIGSRSSEGRIPIGRKLFWSQDWTGGRVTDWRLLCCGGWNVWLYLKNHRVLSDEDTLRIFWDYRWMIPLLIRSNQLLTSLSLQGPRLLCVGAPAPPVTILLLLHLLLLLIYPLTTTTAVYTTVTSSVLVGNSK